MLTLLAIAPRCGARMLVGSQSHWLETAGTTPSSMFNHGTSASAKSAGEWAHYLNTLRLLLSLVLALAAAPSTAREYVGRVVAVTDGDTVRMLIAGNREIKIRLAEVDAPESSQSYGQASKRELSSLVYNKVARAVVTDVDRYGRAVARLYVGERDINAEMVRRGAAWAFTRYSTDPRIPRLERDARAARRGLWSLQADQVQAPWEWRDRKRRPAQRSATSLVSQGNCSKRRCSQMTSCLEALRHLRQCNVAELDRDGDGKPCEKLCR